MSVHASVGGGGGVGHTIHLVIQRGFDQKGCPFHPCGMRRSCQI